jgi:hypothetical protein
MMHWYYEMLIPVLLSRGAGSQYFCPGYRERQRKNSFGEAGREFLNLPERKEKRLKFTSRTRLNPKNREA